MSIHVYHADCMDILKTLPDSSIHAVVSDPPYELGMGDHAFDKTGIAFDPTLYAELLRVLKPGAHMCLFAYPRMYHHLANAVEEAGFEVRDVITWHYAQGMPSGKNVGNDWHTYLKPATEFICLARKPISEKSAQANHDIHGTGALNIGATRINAGLMKKKSMWGGRGNNFKTYGNPENKDTYTRIQYYEKRHTPNLITDNIMQYEMIPVNKKVPRFFFVAKPSPAERKHSHHPTQKPVQLIQYLIKLVTPVDGVVLDPFAGSGTLAIAAQNLGFDAICIEKEDQYVEIIYKRLEERVN